MEKKQIKMSLGTFIAIIVAIILVVVVVFMGIHIANQNKQIEESKVATVNTAKEEATNNSETNINNVIIEAENDKKTEVKETENIESKDDGNLKVENGGGTEKWYYGYNDEYVDKLINNQYSIQNKGDKVYLKVNSYSNSREDIYIFGWETGEYLINGISAKDIKKSLVGTAYRESEEYVVLIFIKNNGEVYYCSDYLNAMDNNIAKKLESNNNFVDAKQGYFTYIDDEFGTNGYGRDVILIDKNGKKYGFDLLERFGE